MRTALLSALAITMMATTVAAQDRPTAQDGWYSLADAPPVAPKPACGPQPAQQDRRTVTRYEQYFHLVRGEYVECRWSNAGTYRRQSWWSGFRACGLSAYDYQSCLAGRTGYGYYSTGYIPRDYDPYQYRYQSRGGYVRPLPDNGARRVQGPTSRPEPYQAHDPRQGNLPTVPRD